MSADHAVVWINQHFAHLVQFKSEQVHSTRINERLRLHRPEDSVLHMHDPFFAKVCDSLHGIERVLVVGGDVRLAGFERYVLQHRPALAQQLVGYQVISDPSHNELLALARECLSRHEDTAVALQQ